MPPKIAFIAENIIASTCASASSGNVTAINTLREWQSRGQIPPQKNTIVSQALVAGARAAPVKTALPSAAPPKITPTIHISPIALAVLTKPPPIVGPTAADHAAKVASNSEIQIQTALRNTEIPLSTPITAPVSTLLQDHQAKVGQTFDAHKAQIASRHSAHADQLESNLEALLKINSLLQTHSDQVTTRAPLNARSIIYDKAGQLQNPYFQKPFLKMPVSGGARTKQSTSSGEGTQYTSYPVSGTRPSQKPLEPEVSGVRGRGEAGPSRSGENFLIPVVKPFAKRQIDQNKIFFMPFKDYRESLSKKSEVDTLFEQMNKNKWGLAKGGSVKKKRKK